MSETTPNGRWYQYSLSSLLVFLSRLAWRLR
jgi:hypothetical protein